MGTMGLGIMGDNMVKQGELGFPDPRLLPRQGAKDHHHSCGQAQSNSLIDVGALLDTVGNTTD